MCAWYENEMITLFWNGEGGLSFYILTKRNKMGWIEPGDMDSSRVDCKPAASFTSIQTVLTAECLKSFEKL